MNHDTRDPNLPSQYGIIWYALLIKSCLGQNKTQNFDFRNILRLFTICTEREIFMMISWSEDYIGEFVEHGEPWFLKPR